MTKVFALYLGIVATCAACGLIQGGGVSKCPTDAVCGWVDLAGENLYLCGSPAQMKALQVKASKLNAAGAK